jgi:hypothetical protein
MHLVARFKTQLSRYRKGEMGKILSPHDWCSSEQKLDIDLAMPGAFPRTSSREDFDKEVESWIFEKLISKKRLRSSANDSHRRTPSPQKKTPPELREDSGISDCDSDIPNASTRQQTLIEDYTTIETRITDKNSFITTKRITTTNPHMLCPCCHGPQRSKMESKSEHRILPHLLREDFVFPNPERRSSQLTTFERYLRDRLLSKQRLKLMIQEESMDHDYECREAWGYGLYDEANEDAMEDEEGERGVHTITIGQVITRTPKAS